MSSKGQIDLLAKSGNDLDFIINNYNNVTVKIDPHTIKDPLTLMGLMGNVCLDGYNPELPEDKCIHIAEDCLEQNHGRVVEFPDAYLAIGGSAKMIRELYTHIIGVTRLQQSTRYSKHENEPFEYFVPISISKNEEALEIYENCCKYIWDAIAKLKDIGIPNEDATMLFPIGYMSEITYKVNPRALMNICEQRLCNKAYNEIRVAILKIVVNLGLYSEQWERIIREIALPKCLSHGACPEKRPCGATCINIEAILDECKKRGIESI